VNAKIALTPNEIDRSVEKELGDERDVPVSRSSQGPKQTVHKLRRRIEV
jgi:hypothetical protein